MTANGAELTNRSFFVAGTRMRSLSPVPCPSGSNRAVAGSEISHPSRPFAKSPFGTATDRAPETSALEVGVVIAEMIEESLDRVQFVAAD